jgi:hypothetical protein
LTELLAAGASVNEFAEMHGGETTLHPMTRNQNAIRAGRIVGIYCGEPLAESLDARCALVDEIFCDANC